MLDIYIGVYVAQNDPPAGISGTPTENNIMFWNAVIFGPEDTPWEGGMCKGLHDKYNTNLHV